MWLVSWFTLFVRFDGFLIVFLCVFDLVSFGLCIWFVLLFVFGFVFGMFGFILLFGLVVL